jgi:hypothetical protein
VKLTATVDRKFTPLEIAQAFCGLNDEEQAQVFIEAARIAAEWQAEKGSLGASWQWFTVGRHLKTCACSTEDARAMVVDIADACRDAP